MSKKFIFVESDGFYTESQGAFEQADHISASAGAADAGKPIILDVDGKLDPSFFDETDLEAILDHDDLQGVANSTAHLQFPLLDGTRDLTGVFSYATHPTFNDDLQLVDKKYVDDVAKALEWQDSVLDADILDPTALTPVAGDRYLIDGVGAGAWLGKDNQIAEFDGSAWVYTVPTTGTFVAADDEPNVVYLFGGSSWVAKYWEQTTASTGLTKVGYDIQLASSAAGDGLAFTAGVLSVNVDNATIELNADTLRVKADGINDTHIDFGTGANQVNAADLPIIDGDGYFAAANVEDALSELYEAILAAGVTYTVGAGGVAKGDLVYLSANDTVNTYSNLAQNRYVVGIALEAKSAGQTVKVLANDTVVTGVLTGATAGAKQFWNGIGFQTTIPATASNYVWLGGIAKNATDLSVEVEFVKRNST